MPLIRYVGTDADRIYEGWSGVVWKSTLAKIKFHFSSKAASWCIARLRVSPDEVRAHRNNAHNY